MNNALGIDHPLVAVRDLETARQTYLSLGFAMRPPGQHPWGTSTALVIFRRQLLELVSIGDDSLLDGHPAGDFQFGRHVSTHLAQRQGVALTALYSDDAAGDAQVVIARGGHCAGTIRFGRDVQRADGTPDRTATTLKILTRPGLARLSMFACQQHRRELIEFPEWMDHPNGATGFASVTIIAAAGDQAAVQGWLETLHGTAAQPTAWGFRLPTAHGDWRVTSRDHAAALFGPVPPDLAPDGAPSVVSLDLRVGDLGRVRPFLTAAGFAHREICETLVLTETDRLGGILLTFQKG